MDGIIGGFVVVVVLCTWGGVALIVRAVRRARSAPPGSREREGGSLVVALGFGLIAAPWLFVAWLVKSVADADMTKGRVLRIKNRARLPELAVGEGWSADEVVLECALPPDARKVLGELWLLTARMEHASVAAFAQLSLHLSALGAPARLMLATHRAALEEIHHAERCFAIARAITGVAHTAGPIVALDRGGGPAIDLTRLAIGSLVDGCLGEGIASDVAGHSALRADEPTIRATLEMIAREEAGHAELAWEVLAWCLSQGGAPVMQAVTTRVEALGAELAPRLPDLAGVEDAALTRFGVVDQDSLGAIARARILAVQARAQHLLGIEVRRAA